MKERLERIAILIPFHRSYIQDFLSYLSIKINRSYPYIR